MFLIEKWIKEGDDTTLAEICPAGLLLSTATTLQSEVPQLMNITPWNALILC